MYALVEIKGKQYKAEKDAVLKVDKLDSEAGSQIEFDSVLLISDGDKVSVGQPYVKNAKIVVSVQDLKKDKKVTTVKFKKRKGKSPIYCKHSYKCSNDTIPISVRTKRY